MINNTVAELALDRASGHAFEAFFKAFFSAIYGDGFVPVGGTKDGGADAFSDHAFERQGKADQFFQASIQKDHRAKIRGTVARACAG